MIVVYNGTIKIWGILGVVGLTSGKQEEKFLLPVSFWLRKHRPEISSRPCFCLTLDYRTM
jgi:hypothetical protein